MTIITAKSKQNPTVIRRFTADVWPNYESSYTKIKEEEISAPTGFNSGVGRSGCNCSKK
jgi:hypothetical protein